MRLVVSAGIAGVTPTGLFVMRMLQFGDAIHSRWTETTIFQGDGKIMLSQWWSPGLFAPVNTFNSKGSS